MIFSADTPVAKRYPSGSPAGLNSFTPYGQSVLALCPSHAAALCEILDIGICQDLTAFSQTTYHHTLQARSFQLTLSAANTFRTTLSGVSYHFSADRHDVLSIRMIPASLFPSCMSHLFRLTFGTQQYSSSESTPWAMTFSLPPCGQPRGEEHLIVLNYPDGEARGSYHL